MKGILYILISSSAFGVMPILAKLAYSKGASTYDVLFLRFLFASIMLLYYVFRNKINLRLTKSQFVRIIILGVFGYSATALCIFKAYNYISAGLSTIILYLYPVIVTLIAFLLYSEKIYKRKIASLVFSSVGVILLVGNKEANFSYFGIFLSFMAAVFYSIYVLGVSNAEIKKINSYVMTFYVSVVAALAMFISGKIEGALNFNIDFYSLICILLIAFISTVVALMTFLEGVKLIGPSKSSILSTLEPIITFFLGVVILGEKLSIAMAIGGIMVILSVLILTLNFRSIFK